MSSYLFSKLLSLASSKFPELCFNEVVDTVSQVATDFAVCRCWIWVWSVLISTSCLELLSSSSWILPCNSSTLCTNFLSLFFEWWAWLCSSCSTCFTTSAKCFSVIFFNWDKPCESSMVSVDSLPFSIASSLLLKLFIDSSSFAPNVRMPRRWNSTAAGFSKWAAIEVGSLVSPPRFSCGLDRNWFLWHTK